MRVSFDFNGRDLKVNEQFSVNGNSDFNDMWKIWKDFLMEFIINMYYVDINVLVVKNFYGLWVDGEI